MIVSRPYPLGTSKNDSIPNFKILDPCLPSHVFKINPCPFFVIPLPPIIRMKAFMDDPFIPCKNKEKGDKMCQLCNANLFYDSNKSNFIDISSVIMYVMHTF